MTSITSFTYRGSLRSCSYACSYCPFAKRRASGKELEADREALTRFGKRLDEISFKSPVSLLIAPYGEAMVHVYYQEFLGELSKKDFVRRVGCQTNGGFDVEACLSRWKKQKADFNKIVLWITFHPEMTAVAEFAAKVRRLSSYIRLSVGAVGNPDSMEYIAELRRELPPGIYVWINQMDGLGRPYTAAELGFFHSVDPVFSWELQKKGAPPCEGGKGHVFVEASGRIFPCNRVKDAIGSIYKDSSQEMEKVEWQQCRGARCDCYLAYSHLDGFRKQSLFGEDSLFRVPASIPLKAVFLDVDGTLTDRDGRIGPQTGRAVACVAEKVPVFLMTERPYELAVRTCADIMDHISGGCYSGGAHIVDGNEEFFLELPELTDIPEGCRPSRLLTSDQTIRYEWKGKPYRLILPGRLARPWKLAFEKAGITVTRQSAGMVSLTSCQAGKDKGMKQLCRRHGIDPAFVMAVGNSSQDIPMLKAAGYPAAVPGSDHVLLEVADFILPVAALAWMI